MADNRRDWIPRQGRRRRASRAGGRYDLISGDAFMQGPLSTSLLRGLYYDSASGTIGYGSTYGEHSRNGHPVYAGPVSGFWHEMRGPLYDPFGQWKPPSGPPLLHGRWRLQLSSAEFS